MADRKPVEKIVDRFDFTPTQQAGIESIFDRLEKAHVPIERHRRLWRSTAWSFEDLVRELEAIVNRVLDSQSAHEILEKLERYKLLEPYDESQRSVQEDEAVDPRIWGGN